LTELIAAMAALTILGLLIAQLLTAASVSTNLSNRLIDAASQARLAFDRLGLDLAAAVIRTDTDFYVGDPTAPSYYNGTNTAYPQNNLLLFLSTVLSAKSTSFAAGDRNLSLIAYRTAPVVAGGPTCLFRAGVPVLWNRAYTATWTAGAVTRAFMGINLLGYPVSFNPSDSSLDGTLLPKTTDFDVLASGVLQMVVGFQLYPDNQAVTTQDGTLNNPAAAQGKIVYHGPARSYSYTTTTGGVPTNHPLYYLDPSRIASLVVGLVTIDTKSLNLLTAAQTGTISAVFPTPHDGQLPVQSWSPLLVPGSKPAGVPTPAWQAIHVYERFYPINAYGNHTL
jgi:hypothetical protein